MDIIFIRHGETDWNVMQKYQGQTDIGINQKGRGDAERLAEQLKDEPVEAIYASDLARAWETAQIIARRLGLEVREDKRLRELSFGVWEGKTFSEVYRDHRDEFQQWYENTLDYQLPGGESFARLLERLWQVIRDIFNRHQGTVLLVTHGGVIKALLYQIQAISHEEMWGKALHTGSLLRLRFDGRELKVLE